MQETFLQVFRSLASWRAEASLATWIDRVACARVSVSVEEGPARSDRKLGGDDESRRPVRSRWPTRPGRRQLARDGIKRLYAVLDELGRGVAPRLHAPPDRWALDGGGRQLVGSTVTATKLRVWRASKKVEQAAAVDPVLAEFIDPVAGVVEMPKESP